MKIKVSEISEDGLSLTIRKDKNHLEKLLGKEGEDDFICNSSLLANMRVEKFRAGTVIISGKVKVSLLLRCVRCLDIFEKSLNINLNYTFLPFFTKGGSAKEVELTGEDLEFAFYHGDEINLLNIILEEIILAVPYKILCQEECLGLCAVCGVNLNFNECRCRDDRCDPRLALLKNFRSKN